MLTEDQAKTKWCPFVRQAAILQDPVAGVAAVNRATPPDGEHHRLEFVSCIGSDCMAWRPVRVHDHRSRHLISKATGKRVNAGYSPEVEWQLDDPNEPEPAPCGYCGLAGRPSA